MGNQVLRDTMEIHVAEDIHQLSLLAGFADVNQFVNSLLDRERERLAIQAGIDSMDEGRVTDFAAFDRQFRETNILKSE
jgi:hypothetical protein